MFLNFLQLKTYNQNVLFYISCLSIPLKVAHWAFELAQTVDKRGPSDRSASLLRLYVSQTTCMWTWNPPFVDVLSTAPLISDLSGQRRVPEHLKMPSASCPPALFFQFWDANCWTLLCTRPCPTPPSTHPPSVSTPAPSKHSPPHLQPLRFPHRVLFLCRLSAPGSSPAASLLRISVLLLLHLPINRHPLVEWLHICSQPFTDPWISVFN